MLSPDDPALQDIPTPALLLDGDALASNVARMAATTNQAGIALRPHAKTHKSDEIARRQMAAGAIGICCATGFEAEALSQAGVDGLLLTAPVMGQSKFEMLAGLHRRRPLMTVVDHPAQVEGLAHALGSSIPPMRVLVDVDVGQRRTGVVQPGDAVALAKAISVQPGMLFGGVQGYAGHAQHIPDAGARRAAAGASAEALRSVVTALNEAGLPPAIVSGSGTGAHLYDTSGPYTELQAGSYVFMDADYARILDERGDGPAFKPSLCVLATVVSVNRPGQVTVDAGTKALAVNGPPPCHIVGAPPGSSYHFTGDEHGAVSIAPGQQAPRLGSRLLISATHCDPTVNLHACYRVLQCGQVSTWPILGRYR